MENKTKAEFAKLLKIYRSSAYYTLKNFGLTSFSSHKNQSGRWRNTSKNDDDHKQVKSASDCMRHHFRDEPEPADVRLLYLRWNVASMRSIFTAEFPTRNHFWAFKISANFAMEKSPLDRWIQIWDLWIQEAYIGRLWFISEVMSHAVRCWFRLLMITVLSSSFLEVLRRRPLWFLWDENDVGPKFFRV
jgi:hypothetical protein